MNGSRILAAVVAMGLAGAPAVAQRVWTPSGQTPVRTTTPQPQPAPAPSPSPAPAQRGHRSPGQDYPVYGGEHGRTVAPDLPNCTITFSGAVTGSYACNLLQSTWRSGDGIGQVRIAGNSYEQVLNRPMLEVEVGFRGAPAAGALHTHRDAVQGTTLWVRYNGAVWAARAGGPGLPVGGYSLYLARAADVGDLGYERAYTTGGTLTADLAPSSGSATGAVHVEVRF